MAAEQYAHGHEGHPRKILQAYGFRPRKALGQTFLVRSADLDRAADAASLSPEDAVLEIGTGMGRLTARLAARAGQVITVEVDAGLCDIARQRLADLSNVTLLRCDFLAGKHAINEAVTAAARDALDRAGRPLVVASNPPYSISSPATVNLLEWEVPVSRLCLMLQREVAERLTAHPGQKQYGPLTVYVDYWATVERLFPLPRRAFWPAPEVSSSFVKLLRRPERRRTEGYEAFAATVRKLFGQRRKTVRKALRMIWGREVAARVVEEAGLDPQMRVDQLATADFEAVAQSGGAPPQ